MTVRTREGTSSVSLLLIVVAIVLFILAALGVEAVKGINLGWLGLAAFAGSFVF